MARFGVTSLLVGALLTQCSGFVVQPCRLGLARGPPSPLVSVTKRSSEIAAGGVGGLRAGMTFAYSKIERKTQTGISIWDVTAEIRDAVQEAGVKEGFVNVINQHTTTAVLINEYESRLVDDIRQFLFRLAPPSAPYLHNDLHLRPQSDEDKQRVQTNGWDISDPAELEAWRAQEPLNAHSHLLSMVVGNSETIPVSGGKLCIGQWQSVMLVDMDGPRTRILGIQVVGNNLKADK